MAILADLKDPRVRDVTVTYVEVSADLRHAKVHVSVMGDESAQRLSLQGLSHAAGFLQAKLNRRIEARYIPRLEFVLDQGVKKSIAVAEILKRVLPPEERVDENADSPLADSADAEEHRAGDGDGEEGDQERPPTDRAGEDTG